MIRKRIINNNDGHIIVYSNEPIRIEITKTGEGFVLYGYKGTKTNMKQEPIIFHDTELKFKTKGENNMKIDNADRHIFLYAKGWYERKDIMQDLKIIVAERCGLDPKYISDLDVLRVIIGVVYPYINSANKFSYFLLECFKDFTKPSFFSKETNIPKVTKELLRHLTTVRVVDNKGKKLLDLGEPDYKLLKKFKR